MKLTNFILKG